MKRTIEILLRLVAPPARLAIAALAVCAAGRAGAATTKTNPVTSATETYAYYFVGGDATSPSDWATIANWKVGATDAAYSETYAPDIYATSGATYGTVLFDGEKCLDNKTITTTGNKIEGWTFKIGLYNGVAVTIDYLNLWSAGQDNVGSSSATVDATSSLIIKEINNGRNWPSTIDYYVAAQNGITYKGRFAPTGGRDLGTIRYWFSGKGSVLYESSVEKCAQVIRQADVTLSGGTKEVKPKTLVSFTSTTKTFTADAAIKVYDTDGTTLVAVHTLSSVNTTGTTTLTTSDAVGTCELVQTSTGVYLYFVDGPIPNNLVIDSTGDVTQTFDSAQEYDAVYVTGTGTVTFSGTASTATVLDIASGASVNMGGALTPTTVTGSGTAIYTGAQPGTTLGFDDSANWTGTVYVKNLGDTTTGELTTKKVTTLLGSDTTDASSNNLNKWGNANSFVKFTNVRGYMAKTNVPWTLILADEGNSKAWYNNEGWSARSITIAGLKGDGTFWDINDGGCRPFLNFVNASQFTGTIKALGKQVFLNDKNNTGDGTSTSSGRIIVPANQTLSVASGKTWHTRNGLVVNGTLNVALNGSLTNETTTAGVSGSGTVVFTGAAPSPTNDVWWKSSDWTGTVQMKGVTLVGTSLEFNNYGNTGSVLELNGCSGWLTPNYTCTVPLKITGTLSLEDGYSGAGQAFKVGTLLGSGTISGSSNAPTMVFNVTDDWSGFTGGIGLNDSKCVVFGATIPDDLAKGTIYISEGAQVTVQNTAAAAWWATGGIKVYGELCANSLARFGDGTIITTSDNGVFTLTSTGNGSEDETDKDYARIQGTGSLKYEGTGWRALSTNDLSTAVAIINEQNGDILLSRALTYTIGSLSGSKKFQGNYGSGSRYLNIVQSKNTEWSGTITSDRSSRLAGFSLDATSIGTLTLSGNETSAMHNDQTATLAVNGGAVNLTGTWKGAVTVSGTFGGTGTLTGAATLQSGSTFKPDGLTVSGGATMASGSTLDLTARTTSGAAVNGALTLDSATTVAFPTGATFPYQLATSIAGVSSLSASQYTIGGMAGAVELAIADGYVQVASSDVTIEAGDSLNWTDIQWSVENYRGLSNLGAAECTINVTGDRTLSVGEGAGAFSGKITLNVAEGKTLTITGTTGAMSGFLAASEICITGSGKVVCSAGNTLVGKITGSGTVEYPNHVLPNVDTTLASVLGVSLDWTDDEWAGTLILPNNGHLNNTAYESTVAQTAVLFNGYGSANSKIKAPGFKGCAATTGASGKVCSAELVIDEGTAVEFNHGTSSMVSGETDVGFIFSKLSGTGELRLDGTSDKVEYVFRDVSGFTGSVLITDPNPDQAEGGKKSFIFGASDEWTIVNGNYPAYLVIADDTTVAAGKKWEVPAGIVILDGATLTLGAGSTVSRISPLSRGVLSVASGTGTVEEIKDGEITADLSIAAEATLAVCDTNNVKSLTIPADTGTTYSNSGTLNLSGTAIEALHLDLGASKTFDLSNVTLPSTIQTIYYDIGSVRDLTGYSLASVGEGTNICYYATETPEEYANGGFTASNVADGAYLWLIRQNGALIRTAAENGTDRTYAGGRSFAGAACWHEWDFEQTAVADRLNDTGRFSTSEEDVASLVTLQTSATLTESDYGTCYVDVQKENKCFINATTKPSASGITFPTTTTGWSTAIRCAMPSTAGQVAIAFGNTTSGMLGLASAANDFVEFFNWNNGTRTVLASLKVESPADNDKMHIYVFTVTNDTQAAKSYVSFYRDGEFIHTAEFALTDTISGFTVGTCGTGNNLPSDATSGAFDYIRLYDKVIPESDITGLSLRRPFVSVYDTYEREMDGLQSEENWVATDKWTKKSDGTAAEVPVAQSHVTLAASGTAVLTVNLETDTTYGTLIFNGGNVVLERDSATTGKISAEMMVVRSGTDLTVESGTMDIASTPLGVDESASLTFDFSNFPFSQVTEVTNVYLSGPIVAYTYDQTVANRILLDNVPTAIWTVTGEIDTTGDAPRYKATITPDHTAGAEVYYGGGYIDGDMSGNVYLESELTTPTMLFAGDTMVISPAWDRADNDAWVSDTFANDIKVTRTTLNLKPGSDNATLAGRTITVESGSALNLKAQNTRTFNFGALTLAGAGTINFADDAAAASLSGTAAITIAADKTLTFGSVDSFVSGGVSGTGTVKLPAVANAVDFDFDAYGNSGSMVELTSFSGTIDTTTSTALKLDGAMTISSLTADATYLFAKISGSGDVTFPASDTPASITIANLDGYSGTLVNNSAAAVTVTKLSLDGVYTGGAQLLATSGTGAVTVSKVYLGEDLVYDSADAAGSDWTLAWADGGLYKAVAKYNGTGYVTIAAALTAAGAEYAEITVLDGTAAVPAGYYVSGTSLVKYPVSITISETVTYLTSLDEAQTRAIMSMPPYGTTAYSYITVYENQTLTSFLLDGLKLKKEPSTVVVTINAASSEYTVSQSEPDASGIITCTMVTSPATYTWTDAYSEIGAGNEVVPNHEWREERNWSCDDVTAMRAPTAGDTVVFADGASVKLTENTSCAAITVSGAVAFSADSAFTLTSVGAIDLPWGASIAVTSVTLSPTPTTTVENASVNSAISDGTTTYSVVANAQITDVTFEYYASYTNADVTVTVDQAGTYTLTVNGKSYAQTAAGAGTIAFTDVDMQGLTANSGLSWTITASGGTSGTANGTSPAKSTGDVTDTGWMDWSKSGSQVGGWKDGDGTSVTPDYGDNDYVAFSGTNVYTAAWTSTGEVVTVTTSVAFGSPADSTLAVDADAQAAIRIGTMNDANVFQVYAGTTSSWVSVYNDTLGAPADTATYALTLTLNYANQTFGVSVGDAGALTNATGTASFPLAKNASTMQKVSYLGAGTFTSLAGSYVSAGYSADVGTDESATNVVVASSFVERYLSGIKASEVSAALSPTASSLNYTGANRLNYFTNYALGLDPTKEEDKPIVDVTTDENGKYVFTVKHPVYNAQGEIIGYEKINAADNVSTTVTLKYGTEADSIATVESGAASGISPADMFEHAGAGNVLYYKAEVTIGAK